MSWTLEELFARCERTELDPLCRILRVNPDGLGGAALVDILARSLRRAGGHGLVNIARRKGEGPTYTEVLAALCDEEKLVPQADIAATELALVGAWLIRSWERLSEGQRASTWRLLELGGEVPKTGMGALTSARQGLKAPGLRLTELVRTGGTLAIIASPPMAPLGCLAFLWVLGKPDHKTVLAAVAEIARLRQLARHRVTIGVVGSPSAGKDAAIKALFGLDTGNVNPVAGSTREVAVLRVPGALGLTIVNTPGLGDIIESVTEEARKILNHLDVMIYLVNAQGGVQVREREDWSRLVDMGHPTLAVINKIDTLRPEQRQRYLDDAREKLGVSQENFLSVAFDPLPQLADAPIGVAEVRTWLRARLVSLGKDPVEIDALWDE